MLEPSGLKDWLHRNLPVRDKLLLILATFDQPVQLADMRTRAEEAGFKVPTKWNMSDVLGRSNGLGIRDLPHYAGPPDKREFRRLWSPWWADRSGA